MRKRITKTLMAAVALCVSFSAAAYDFEAGGIYYNITSEADKTVEVTQGDSDYSGDITIPATVTNSGTVYTVMSIGEEAFSGCSGLNSINIPDGVAEIVDFTFSGCYGLTTVTLGNGVKTIGEWAFEGCSNLASINIPDGVTEIGFCSFLGCYGLTAITLGSGVTEIESYAFCNCTGLTTVTLGSGLETIGGWAFSNCTGLAEINSLATAPLTCGTDCFYDVDKANCSLYVPEGTADAYKGADGWKDFCNIVETDFAGSEEIATDAAAEAMVYAAAGRIDVENAAAGTPIAVYSADGVQIYCGAVSDAHTEIPAPTGKLYIVKCGNTVFKTVM